MIEHERVFAAMQAQADTIARLDSSAGKR